MFMIFQASCAIMLLKEGERVFKKLFNADNPLMITMSRITDCIFLSLFWLLGSFPVLTLGAASAALYDGVYYGFRKQDKHPWSRFFKSFRRNLLPGLVPSAVYLMIFLLCGWGMIRLWNGAVGGSVSWMLFAAGAFGAVVVLGILSVLFPMLSRFENSLGALLKNTLFIALANLPRTVALGIVNGAVLLLCLRFIFPAFFLPAVAALLGTFLLEPMFRPYMPEETEETIVV